MVQLRPCLKVLIRPSCFVILLGLCAFMVAKLSQMSKRDESIVASETIEFRNKLFSEIETTASLVIPLNMSAQNLARVLGASLNGTELTFPTIQTKVAPTLFVALSTVPFLTQVGYFGSDGLFFSFYCTKDTCQTVAVYRNTSHSSSWYSQPVNSDTGKPFGDAVTATSPTTMNMTWFGEALNNTNGYSSLGTGWNEAQDLQFFHTVAMDGRGLISMGFRAQQIIDHFANTDFHGGDFHLATTDGVILVPTRLPNTQILVGNSTVTVRSSIPKGKFRGALICKIKCKDGDNDDKDKSQRAKINGGTYYRFYCSTIELAGIRSIYVVAFPQEGLVSLVAKDGKLAHTLLVLVFISVLVSVSIFLYFGVRAARREMYLCTALIKQMEATQQAESKSMNKSVAFASASHDSRALLAVITGLLELSHEEANPGSELAANLGQMSTCAKDLLGILNTVLDTSKIEAGKMQLEEEEFNLAQLLEDVVDSYYNAGIKKGVDVMLDPCDGSILKSPLVKGDRGKLKQILCNLLGNAIKFTSEGHVSVRAMVKKTISLENSIIASNQNFLTKCVHQLSVLFDKDREGFKDLDTLNTVQHNPNYKEFEFEVDDTGKGIPCDKWKSVFENFVQVNETAQGQEGVGLGLGIVQSLVRLMGGEIRIFDKEPGERGTCFEFSIFLTTSDSISTDFEGERDSHRYFGLHLRQPMPRPEVSHVILVIASDERRRMSKEAIESLGIRVSSIKRGRDLHMAFEKIRPKLDFSNLSPSRKTDMTLFEHFSISASASENSNSGRAEGVKDATDHSLSHCRKSYSKHSSSFILVVVDAGAGLFSELCSIVSNFRKEIQNIRCKVVWLDNPNVRNVRLSSSKGDWIAPPCDYILSKPFHGSRFYQVLGLLPEYGGVFGQSTNITSSELHQIVIHDPCEQKSCVKPLDGKKILVVEDSEPLRKVTTAIFCKLGAEFDACENGKEAVDRVREALWDQSAEGCSKVLPYDYIFMDCEMPIMDGYEATRLIRMEEKQHDIHIPIIALTAHAMAEETSKTLRAGMDLHLTKPLLTDKLLEVIRSLDDN